MLANRMLGPNTAPPYDTINFVFWMVFYLCLIYAAIMRFKWLSNYSSSPKYLKKSIFEPKCLTMEIQTQYPNYRINLNVF